MAKEKESANQQLTYDQLKGQTAQLFELVARYEEEIKKLKAYVNEQNKFDLYKRIDYLFKVVEFEKAFDNDFVRNCVSEISTIMTIEEDKN